MDMGCGTTAQDKRRATIKAKVFNMVEEAVTNHVCVVGYYVVVEKWKLFGSPIDNGHVLWDIMWWWKSGNSLVSP